MDLRFLEAINRVHDSKNRNHLTKHKPFDIILIIELITRYYWTIPKDC